MKIIKYYLKTIDENGEAVQGPECSMPYSEENLALAESEAFGEVTVKDDGLPEPEVPISTEERLSALEDAVLEMILGGES